MSRLRLTPRAEAILKLAEADAIARGDNYVGTEHILIGLMREGEGIAAGVLESMTVTLTKVTTVMDFLLGTPHPDPSWPSRVRAHARAFARTVEGNSSWIR